MARVTFAVVTCARAAAASSHKATINKTATETARGALSRYFPVGFMFRVSWK
jgi:hypothetical protein